MKHSTGPTGNSEFCFPVTFNGTLRLLRETLIDHITAVISHTRPSTIFLPFQKLSLVDVNQMYP